MDEKEKGTKKNTENEELDANEVSLKKYAKIVGIVMLILFTIVGAIFSALNWLNLSFFYVSGNSMNPTLKDGDIAILQYEEKINFGDVAFFKSPEKWNEVSGDANNKNIFVKRVVAIPGDNVKINSQGLSVSGVEIVNFEDEDYTCKNVSKETEYSHVLNSDQIFLVGDNHKDSVDSLRVFCEQGEENAYLSNLEVIQHGKVIKVF